MRPLDGQVELGTGCARWTGIGRGAARALAEAGADVAVSDVSLAGAGRPAASYVAAQLRGVDGGAVMRSSLEPPAYRSSLTEGGSQLCQS
jgi:NAD(P)-dependent dehydrogenase (short-subunit alcohol dehydrogenase family)